MNEVSKTRIDLEVKDLKERKDTINKIMGEILKDMTRASRDKIEKIKVKVVEVGLDSEEFGLVCKCEGDTIDLLLDTGTVSNLVPEGQREVVHNIKNETTSLIGVGGARVTATETGQAGAFGKSRIVPGAGALRAKWLWWREWLNSTDQRNYLMRRSPLHLTPWSP